MATGKISKRTVDSIEPASKVQFLWDTDLKGFGVKVTPAGAISYLIQFRMGGREAKSAATQSAHMARLGRPLQREVRPYASRT